MADRIAVLAGVRGAVFVDFDHGSGLYTLKYGKYASIRLLSWMYRDSVGRRLERKFEIWRAYVANERAGVIQYRRASTRRRVLTALDAEGA